MDFNPSERPINAYLKSFKNYCLEKYGENLAGLMVYGSYQWDYFKDGVSDYDMWVLFKDKITDSEAEVKDRFDEISIHYLLSIEEMYESIRKGSFGNILTLLTLPQSATILYTTEDLIKLIQFTKQFFDKNKSTLIPQIRSNYLNKISIQIEQFENKYLNKDLTPEDKYYLSKICFQFIRLCLQLIYLVKTDKLTWDLNKIESDLKNLMIIDLVNFETKLWKAIKDRKGADITLTEIINYLKILKECLSNS